MHSRHSLFPALRSALLVLALASLLLNAAQAAPASTEVVKQATYSSPELASQALLEAVKKDDPQDLRQVLGDASLIETDQPELDLLERRQFVQKYGEMHRLVHRTDGSVVINVGPENWPFPVPIVPQEGGWRFDPRAGLREVVFRRIGENELTAIEVCHGLVDAKLRPNQPLPASEEEAATLVPRVLAQHGGQSVRFHGYEYRLVAAKDGSFLAVAYPAEYRASGVMTFVAGRDDVVYEKDLGRHSAAAAHALKASQPDASWRRSETQTPVAR
jgi:hypothetical protein